MIRYFRKIYEDNEDKKVIWKVYEDNSWDIFYFEPNKEVECVLWKNKVSHWEPWGTKGSDWNYEQISEEEAFLEIL